MESPSISIQAQSQIGSPFLLSAIIIGRNEERNIARCIESVIVAGEALSEPYEVIFIDSASTDASVSIANKYPITVVRIQPGEWMCAAAGRTIGVRFAKGDYIAFIDGDMTVDPEWFINGLRHLRKNAAKVGLVTGGKEYIDATSGKLLKSAQQYEHVRSVIGFGGSAIIAKSALDQSGGFNPYLISNEEADLSDRLQRVGYTLLGIPTLMIKHYGPEPGIEETIRRGNYGYYIGLGQYIRRLCSRGEALKALLKIKVQLAFIAWILTFVLLTGLGILTSASSYFYSAVLSFIAYWSVFVVRMKGITDGTRMLYSQPFIIWGVIKGCIQQPEQNNYEPSIDIMGNHQ